MEVFEEADVRGQGSVEVEAGDIEGHDGAVVGGGVEGGAYDASPSAVVSGGVPGGERILWVFSNGGFYAQQSLVFGQYSAIDETELKEE